MAGFRLVWNDDTQTADWLLVRGGIATGHDFETAVILSLFTWARAGDDDELPYPNADRKGWWGNLDGLEIHGIEIVGSKLWLLSRALATEETLQRAIAYAAQSLKWFTDLGAAAKIDVTAEWQGARTKPDRLALGIKIYRADGSVILDQRFAWAWTQLQTAGE